jgi:hypothetical protein
MTQTGADERLELLQGTLDMLGRASEGHGIGQAIRTQSR